MRKDNTVKFKDPIRKADAMQHPPNEDRIIRGKISVRPKGKGFQIYFRFNKKQIWIDHRWDGLPLKTDEDVEWSVLKLKSEGWYPDDWGKEIKFQLQNIYEEWQRLSTASQTTKDDRRRSKKKYVNHFGADKDIRKIETSDINKFHKHLLDAGMEPKSIRNYIYDFKTFMYFFSDDIPKMPKFPKISYQKKVKDVLTMEQQAKVYEFLPKEHLPIFIFLKYSASRPNEAGGLLWEDVHHDTKEIYVQHVITPDGKIKFGTKTKLIRKLMLIPEFEQILQRKDDSPLVFHRNGKAYNTKALEDVWNVAMEKAQKKYPEIPRISLYPATKHSFIVDRLNAGWSYEEICAVTGHTTLVSVRGYGRYNLEKVGEIMRGKKEKPFIPSRPAAPLRKRMNLEKETEKTDDSGKTLASQSESLTIQNHSESMVGRTGIEPVTY